MANLNLLPLELRRDLPRDWSKLLPKLMAVCLVATLLIAYLFFLGFNMFLEKQKALLEQEIITLGPQVKQAQEAQQIISKLEIQKKELENILVSKGNWNKILWGINDVLPQDIWLTAIASQEDGKLMLSGTCQDIASLGVFLFELNKLPYFTSAQLVKADSQEETSTETVFEIAVVLEKGREK